MTSASELFYNRRSRYNSRTATHDLGFDSLPPPLPDRNHNHNRRHHNHHHESDGCDPLLRRTPRHLRHRSSLPERAAIGAEQGGAHSGSGNAVGASGPGLSGNERLPGSVLLARERLLERLRGMPPSQTRHRRALNVYGSGLVHGDESSPLDVRDWGTEILTSRSAGVYPSTILGSQIERQQLLQEANKKPPGLTQEVLDCLSPELFSSSEMDVDGLVLRASRDCSICLESFLDGDELINLPCAHRFHAVCLGPWVRIRGDCPYCRRVIVVNSHTDKRTT